MKIKQIQQNKKPPSPLHTCCVCELWQGIFRISSIDGMIYDYWCEKHIGKKIIKELITSSRAYEGLDKAQGKEE